jgi:hypothetical protein
MATSRLVGPSGVAFTVGVRTSRNALSLIIREFLEEFRHLKGVVALGLDLGAHGDEENRGPGHHALALCLARASGFRHRYNKV